jgi:hypothetical protein
MRPSPEDNPDWLFSIQGASTRLKNISIGPVAEPFRPDDVGPTPQMNRFA